MKALENQDRNNEQQDSDDEKIKFTTGLARDRFATIDSFCAFDSFRRQLECPGQNHRHGKSDNEQQHYKTHSPIRNLEERKNLTRDLHQQPRNDCVGDRNFVNVAPLQLDKEFAQVHNELFRITRNDFLRQRLEAWIVAQRLQWREYIYIRYHDLFVLVTSLEPLDCFVLITETRIGYSDEESREFGTLPNHFALFELLSF